MRENPTASALRAMENGLWDVAIIRLEKADRLPDLSEKDRTEILILLAECLVRDGKPAQAFTLLEQSLVKNHPDAAFWTGQALAGQGRFSDTVAALLPLAADPGHHLRREAAFTTASLQLSLSQPAEALATLRLLEDSSHPFTAVSAKLHRIEILSDLGNFPDARKLFPTLGRIPVSLKPHADLLDARLLLAEDKPGEAEEIFTALLAKPSGQTLGRYHVAALGKADAIAALGDPDAATEFLLAFLQANPDSPVLESAFERILLWLPGKILSAEHPTLVRLEEWIPQTAPTGIGFINTTPDSAAAAWPLPATPVPDLSVFALYARTIGLHRIDTPATKKEAELLFQRLRLIAPRHFLTPRSLLTLARWKLDDGDPAAAISIYETLRLTAKSALVRGEAAFRDAQIAFSNGDKSLAASLFDEAATLLEETNRNSASYNSALVRLSSDPGSTFLIQNDNPETAAKLNTDLALEKALLSPTPAEARTSLDAFLTAYPDHPRAAEARLAISEAALRSNPPDLSLARAQLDTLRDSQSPLPASQAPRLALTTLRLADLSGKNEEALALAKDLIATFPETPQSAEAALLMGKSLFESGDYNEARLILEKLATSEPGTQRSQAALLLAARSAALGATDQSREEALALFDKAIAAKGPLRSLAILEKARLNIDLNRLPAAIAALREAYKATAKDDPSRLPTGLMLAEAIYSQGDSEPSTLEGALEIYDQLLGLTEGNPSEFFRLQYLRGLTLEKLPDPENPGQTRLGEAKSAYFSVLDRPVDPPPPEWEWFYKSGFRALHLLENAAEWEAAVAIAEKIASFNGPLTEDAATRARQIRLKHMIYEEPAPDQ